MPLESRADKEAHRAPRGSAGLRAADLQRPRTPLDRRSAPPEGGNQIRNLQSATQSSRFHPKVVSQTAEGCRGETFARPTCKPPDGQRQEIFTKGSRGLDGGSFASKAN
jgi:hypothetical protein